MNISQFLVLLVLGALWGASFLFMRIAAPEIGAVWLIEFRVLIAGLVLLPWLLNQKGLRSLWLNAKDLFVVGALNSALPFVLIAYITTHIAAGITSILNAIVPIVGVVISYLFIKEKLTPLQLLGIAFGFSGVVLLMTWQQASVVSPSPLMVLAALIASISYVLGAHYTKKHMVKLSPIVFTTGTQLAAACLLLPLLPFFVPQHIPDSETLLSIFALAVFSTSLAFVYYFKLIHELGPTKTLTVTYLIPAFGLLWGALFLDEVVTRHQIISTMLILIGVALSIGTFKLSRRGVGDGK